MSAQRSAHSPATLQTNRRGFLRSSSALIALPFLESLGSSAFAAPAKLVAPPKRMIFLGFGWGVTRKSWYPDLKTTGTDYELPAGLASLKCHQKDITVIQNLTNRYSNEGHWGSTSYLTGANRFAEPGQSFHNSISADQVAAEVFGKETRFTSLQLGCDNAESSGHGPGLSMAWNGQGKPIAGLNTPLAAFHKLFADGDTPLEQRQAMLKQQRSVLDTVLESARSMSGKLSQTDTGKLDEYLQSIRDIEVRLSKEEQWLEVPKIQPKDPINEPGGEIEGYEEVKLMYDIMIAAMQVDATRVMTYRQPVDSFIKSLGATISAHNMSHYTNDSRRTVSEMRDDKQTELLASFIDRLKASKQADGSSLFDHTTLSYGSNIESIHDLRNCPTVITGGGAGVQHGRHLVMENAKTPLCNLWLSLLQGSGIEVDSHGDSTAVIDELFA